MINILFYNAERITPNIGIIFGTIAMETVSRLTGGRMIKGRRKRPLRRTALEHLEVRENVANNDSLPRKFNFDHLTAKTLPPRQPFPTPSLCKLLIQQNT